MTQHIVALVAGNALMAVLGTGLLPLLHLAATRRDLLTRLPLGYLVGITATGILAAELAVIDIPVGWIALTLLAAIAFALGLRRTSGATGPLLALRWTSLAPAAVLALAAAFLISAVRLFAVKPLLEFDGWWIWGTRARALYDFGHPVSPVFTSQNYPALQHPLWLPALEAVDFRFMRTFDGTLVHLQLIGLAIGFVAGGWVLLRRHASPPLLAATLLAILTAPSFFNQLQTNFADIPLAMLTGLGVASLVAWLRSSEPGMLAAAVLFLGAGAITKNEGEVFALAAYVAATIVARRGQRRPIAYAALATFAIDLPWRIWIQLHHVKISEYSISNLFNPPYLWAHRDRVSPSAHELLTQLSRLDSWSYLALFVVAGLGGALAAHRLRLAAFGTVWLALSFIGLLAIYWISTNTVASHLENSSDRTIDTLVIGGALLIPVLFRTERANSRA